MSLLDFAFRERPIWRQRFDRHVRDWDRHMRRRVFVTYHTDAEFKRAYDARLALTHQGLAA